MKMIHKKIYCNSALHASTLQDPPVFILNPKRKFTPHLEHFISSPFFDASCVKSFCYSEILCKSSVQVEMDLYIKIVQKQGRDETKIGLQCWNAGMLYSEDGWKKMVSFKLWCAHSHLHFGSKCEDFIVVHKGTFGYEHMCLRLIYSIIVVSVLDGSVCRSSWYIYVCSIISMSIRRNKSKQTDKQIFREASIFVPFHIIQVADGTC